MRRRRLPCWAWGPLLAVPLLMLATCVPGKRIVDGDLERRAQRVLTGAGLDGVRADFDWATGTLTGPADLEGEALALVGLAIGKDKRYALRYVADGTESAPTTTTVATAITSAAATTAAATSAAPTTLAPTTAPPTTATPTTAAASIGVDALSEISGTQIVLRGRVATQAHRTAIVDAARAAFGASRVADQLTVSGATSTAVDEAVRRYAALLGQLAPRLSTGTATIRGTAITVTGTGFNAQAVTEMNAAVQAASGAGVTATASLQAAATDPAQLANQLTALLGRSGINFAPDSADIDAASRPVLDTAAASIVAVPSVKIEIGGHTDSDGSVATNQALSQRRAEAVLAYLVGKGVNAAQLTARGYGPSEPIADNATAEGRAANRRIEFVVTGS